MQVDHSVKQRGSLMFMCRLTIASNRGGSLMFMCRLTIAVSNRGVMYRLD